MAIVRSFAGTARHAPRALSVSLAMVLLGIVLGVMMSQPAASSKPLPPDLREDPRAATALADVRVQTLLDGTKFRVVNIQEILDYEKAGYPAGSVVVQIFDYTHNVGLGVVVTPDLLAVDLFYPHAIGLTEVEERIAFQLVTFDVRFRRLVAGQDRTLSAVGVAGPPGCDFERCVAVFVGTAPKSHSEQRDFRMTATFIVSLSRDAVLAVEYL